MGRLHDRMAEDLVLRNFSPATRRNYLLYARTFAAFFMRSPEDMGEPEIRQFLLHQLEIKQLPPLSGRVGEARFGEVTIFNVPSILSADTA